MFQVQQLIHTQRSLKQMNGVIVKYEEIFQIHTSGVPDLVLDYCDEYFDGEKIQPLDDTIRHVIHEQYEVWNNRQDFFCLGMSYRPIDPKFNEFLQNNSKPTQIVHVDDEEDDEKDYFKTLQKGQIFLGMIGLRKQPKEEIQKWISDLSEDSGIRFIYASPHNQQKTKAFGKALGLDTEWNSCISLQESSEYLDESTLKAKLPNGIPRIKEHLQSIDNVPLLVPLFSDVLSESGRDMIQILQNYGEIVFVVGNSTNFRNTPIYSQGNISMMSNPNSLEQDNQLTISKTVESFEKSGTILDMATNFHLKDGNIFNVIFHLIREGRRNITNLRQSLEFFLICNMILFGVQFLGVLTLLPPILNGIQCFFMILIIIPMISLSLLSNPEGEDVMNLISNKNLKPDHSFKCKPFPRCFSHNFRIIYHMLKQLSFLIKAIIPIIIGFFMYLFTFTTLLPHISWNNIFGNQITFHTFNSNEFQATLIYSQNILMITLVLFFCAISIGELHPRISLFKLVFKNPIWFLCIPLSLLSQLLFSAISISLYWKYLPIGYPRLPFYSYIILIFFLVLIILIQELYKIKKRSWFITQQKRMKLEFGTKLGMYS